MSSVAALAKVWHPLWGGGALLRIEGTDWIVQLLHSGKTIRVPTDKRREFELLSEPDTSTATTSDEGESVAAHAAAQVAGNGSMAEYPENVSVSAPSTRLIDSEATSDPPAGCNGAPSDPVAPAWSNLAIWHKKRAIESLANGLPPAIAVGRQLAVGFDSLTELIRRFLGDVDNDGGCALLVKGTYGQGKTFALRCLEDIALEAGYLVARTEIDATENRLNKPHHICRDLLRHLRIPQCPQNGPVALAKAANAAINRQTGTHSLDPCYRLDWLERNLGCAPLAWLLSDPGVDRKQELLALLACDPAVPTAHARRCHALQSEPRRWPAFNAGTQGDFGSYLLSGIGRLARLMDFKGLILILDEMEKWQDLNWNEQSQAGNLLGGLIWGATERTARGRRPTYAAARVNGSGHYYPRGLTHSSRCGGFPFSTEAASHVGLAIAMTPRSDEQSPERAWSEYGPILEAELPRLNAAKLGRYCRRVAPLFCDAHATRRPTGSEMEGIVEHALGLWRSHGEMTNRAAVQSAVAAFDHWRDMVVFSADLSGANNV